MLSLQNSIKYLISASDVFKIIETVGFYIIIKVGT